MFKKEYREQYISEMLANPIIRPVFEEYYSFFGRYPGYIIDFTGTDEQLAETFRGMIEDRKKLLSRMPRERIAQ